ncbi:MAG TPA: DoxX family protein [Bacteroidia bacterium]|jgi:putative oxidoreductase|nr:DoxX family protein [Bacteroidia bacterium]
MKYITHPTFLLRFALSVVFAAHSVRTILDGSVNDFGKLYLNEAGFAPFGLLLAWIIKLTHLISVPLLLINKYLKPVCIANLFILVVGIFMVHLKEGWFVVGGGRNGVEFNFVLIFMLLTILFPNGLKKNKADSDLIS